MAAVLKYTDYQMVPSLLSWGQKKTLMTAVVKYTISSLLAHHKRSAVHLKMRGAKLTVQLLPNTDELLKTATALLDGWNLSVFSNLSLLS